MTCRMTRRCRVSRIPRSLSVLVKCPVVSEVLMRSPVEARCAGVAAMKFLNCGGQDDRRPQDFSRRSNSSNDVIVHDVDKQQQKEHKSDLNKSLFHRQAKVAAK